MKRWKKSLSQSITSPDDLARRFGIDPEPLRAVAALYPFRITPHYLSLIREPGDPIWRQAIPDILELADNDGTPDPLFEEKLSPFSGIIHRYPDRVVLLVSNNCAVYCRFCMRKRRVGCDIASTCNTNFEASLQYIAEHSEIRDVILSGGDPLLLDDEDLYNILSALRRISHVEIIRIGTRAPVTLPDRITPALCKMLGKFHPLFLNTHFNHPWEITPESSKACEMLATTGIPLGNQTVLLKGVNDDPGVMKQLMQSLLKIRVKPYYIHQMDLVKGTKHFRTPIDVGIEVMEALRGHTSGLATPYFVIDLVGGKGKTPILPDYVRREGERLFVRNYCGEIVEYVDN